MIRFIFVGGLPHPKGMVAEKLPKVCMQLGTLKICGISEYLANLVIESLPALTAHLICLYPVTLRVI